MAGYKISEHFAERIKSTIQKVDSMPASFGDGLIPRRHEERLSGRGGTAIYEATFSGGWVKGAPKQIRFSANTNTTSFAINLFRSIPYLDGSDRACIVAKRESALQQGGVEYVLVNAEC